MMDFLSGIDWNRMSKNGALSLPPGFLTRSGGIVDRRGVGPIFIRRRTHTEIVNIWLILIVLVGAMIAVADGLTRTPILERLDAWNGPMEYDPYPGALLFAGLTLPLMIAYARKARVSLTEGLFLWYVFCTTAYTRDFSYVRFPGAPLFVTDVVLLVLLLSIYLFPPRRGLSTSPPESVFLLLFLGAGALSAARGFWGHREAMVVLRDSALVMYSLFLLVGYHLFRSWTSIKRLAVWFLLGAVLSVLNGLGWFVNTPSERRFIYYGIYVLISLAGVPVAMASHLLNKRIGWVSLSVLCVGLLLANTRSLYVSLVVIVLLGLWCGRSIWNRLRPVHLVSTLGGVAALITLGAFLFLHGDAGRDFAQRSAVELSSGVLNASKDPYWQFRLSAWTEAWRRFAEYPLAGEGFGVPFVFDLADFDARPHNTFLTVLYKMGFAGFLPLLALLVYFFWIALHAVHRNLANQRAAFLLMGVLAQVAFLVLGTANLVLESPFLASLFWASMGLSQRMIHMLDLERSLQVASQSSGAR
jgi:O-antigen ligase